MKYKKLKPFAITPLIGRIVCWVGMVHGLLFFALLFWLCISFVAHEIFSPYGKVAYMKLLFMPKSILNGSELLTIIFFLGILIPITLMFTVPLLHYTAKFYSRKFKLSDIRNPEKYDPDVIRQYFPEYLSKKEREERAANTDEKVKEDLQKATEIINKYTKELGEDKVISIIKGI